MLNTKFERLSWVLKGSNRRKIYQALLDNDNLTSIEISNITGIIYPNVCRVVKDFNKYGLIEDIAPNSQRTHLYSLTCLALEFKYEFQNHQNYRKEKVFLNKKN